MKAAAKPNPPPLPSAATSTQPSTKAASSSSSSAADPNPKRILPTAADAAHSTPSHPNPNPNGAPNPPPLLPSPHVAHLQPLPPPRPLLTVAAVEAAMASIPPPPQYGLECLDRRTVALSDGTVRTYFALPLEPPPQLRQPPIFPAPHLGPPGPGPGLNRWIPPLMHAVPPPWPPQKRKREGQSNGGPPVESSGRQHQQHQKPEERRTAKQVKVETSELDAKTLESSFLKMVRVINENTEVKKNYRANGQISQLRCVVCNRDSMDLHALLNHSYNTRNPELRADHLGLHKAICVLMGWNYSIDPVNRKAYQTLSTADAEANQGDHILWPPTIIVENTYKSNNDGQKDAMTNKEMDGKLREMGFAGVSVKPLVGKDGAMLVTFASNLAGLKEAARLAELLETEGHGRAQWVHARGLTPSFVGGSNPMFVKVDETGQPTWVLYGYLATAWDLDTLDAESRQNVVIKSRKEFDLSE
ncbi:hypothetical protein CFC21_052454 [Triticum aestivum]|uniref:XS domain-containing protein n=3 Tax=Triticum TaxID=4564 RepID=A0A9R0W056_TRITD|nr:uncharacterized protein LOC123086145 [Triticum aestivum]KAF7042987.1 hypothetical protein CFC21_052454 [Triticum aestivum]VAH91824.1 unnamed protein product [Triticum turgidum subsp. durum]